jgi:ribose 5-phosphate isomerase A
MTPIHEPMTQEDKKRAAGLAALDFIEDGMAVGLGTGSTAAHFVRALGAKVAAGLTVRCVPTSDATARLAHSFHIPLVTLEDTGPLDVTVDGADEIDAEFNLIKGGGGALLREKIVAYASRKFVVIADGSKMVDRLGAFPLPVEIVPFGLGATIEAIAQVLENRKLPDAIEPRTNDDGRPFFTDSGNVICDLSLGAISDAPGLAQGLSAIPGVVEHGLFIAMTDHVVLGTDRGVEVRP